MSIKDTIESLLGERLTGPLLAVGRVVAESGAEYFLKSGPAGRAYRCEANGLAALAAAGAVRTPTVMAVADAFILTGFIREGKTSPAFFADLGARLARLHRVRAANFGFYEDNYIGANPQPNVPLGNEAYDWTAFYFNRRLLYQYRLAERNGYASSRLRTLFAGLERRIGKILEGSDEGPCLIHGDLWAGNFLCDTDGRPVLIDPAVYYGHREAELAMTRLFGGFSPAFYEAYEREYPLAEGWQYRERIYRLYHVLNHLNLFGRGYLSEAERLLEFYAK